MDHDGQPNRRGPRQLHGRYAPPCGSCNRRGLRRLDLQPPWPTTGGGHI
jgi:hypothetical protein